MVSAPTHVHRHFISWDRPLLPQLAAWLARDWSGTGPLDLSGVMAIVPTRQAGRRLREALAEHAAMRGAAVFPPRAHTPDTLLALGAAAPDVASRLEALLAWSAVLRELDLATVPDVFPVEPPRRDFAWAWRLAESFFRLQTQLMEAGLAFADVVGRAGAEFPERARWQQLATLERRQRDKLAALGRREPHAAWREFAAQPPLPAGIRRLVLLAAPDPLPLALDVLAAWARELPLDVVIFAPREEATVFDSWGRPLAPAWERRRVVLPDFEQRVHLCADPAAQAERIATVVREYPEPDGLVGLGVADPAVLPLLENALSRAGRAGYNPEGRERRSESLYALLAALADLAREASIDAVAALARCPDFLAALQARNDLVFSIARWLAALDQLRERHLPPDLTEARAHARAPELISGLALVEELRAVLVGGAFPANAVAALGRLFEDRRFDLARETDARVADSAEAWREVMRACEVARGSFADLSAADWWEVALRFFGDSRRTEEKPWGAVDLQGWLELLWEDAPHLIVAGFNDGLVPDVVVGDAFLPEALRERLGLKTNAARFARDAYILQAIAACRNHAAGRLDLLLGKVSQVGDPLRPSQLLLRCEDAELPARVRFLFRSIESTRPNLPWTRAWKLRPPRPAPPAAVPVTGLRTWLACPFRFYLAHGLKMEPVDAAKSELDARDFGTLCHTALEAMARDPHQRESVDEHALREFLIAQFDRAARERFGENLTLPLVIQLESARQRLSKAATVQARERAAGWVIEHVESKFALDLGGLEIRGKIDRIDRHESSGLRRVLDYKTADTATPPHKTHLRPFRAGDERFATWMRVKVGGREQVWADLQLPLYLRALESGVIPGGSADAVCGYFNLPKAASETGLALWKELSPELLDSARVCADGVAAAIRAGEFWPPAEITPERDPFAALFHHGAEESVEWELGSSARS